MNIHVAALRRLLVGWLIIAAVVGGAGYWLGLGQISKQLTSLAQNEVNRLTPLIVKRINGNRVQIAELQNMAEEYKLGGFVSIEVFDRRGKRVAEKRDPDVSPAVGEVVRILMSRTLNDDSLSAVRVSENGIEAIRLSVPLLDETETVGHVEGIYVVPPERVAELHRQVQQLVIVALFVTLFTTVLLYPFIISLDRRVQSEARRILRGNLDLMGVLGSAIAKRDAETNSHNYRVTLYAVRLAERAGMSADEIRSLICGAFLHDLGKIGIADEILRKPGPLSEQEYAVMRQHVTLGLEIASHSEWLHQAVDVIACHHEWFDGSGYPAGLAGDRIPLAARVFAIVDVFDALASQRHYKARLPLSEALALMRDQAGTHFDPILLTEFSTIAADLYLETEQLGVDELQKRLGDLLTHFWNTGNWFGTARQRLGWLAELRLAWRRLRNSAPDGASVN